MAKWIEKWGIKGESGKIYTVALANDGTYGCSCPQWCFRRKIAGDCKHIKIAKILHFIDYSIERAEKNGDEELLTKLKRIKLISAIREQDPIQLEDLERHLDFPNIYQELRKRGYI